MTKTYQKSLRKILWSAVIYPLQWLRLMRICFKMAVKRMGMLGESVREAKELPLKKKVITIIGKKKTKSDMLCVLTDIISKVYFISRHLNFCASS